jgi:hypothetical protein
MKNKSIAAAAAAVFALGMAGQALPKSIQLPQTACS